MLFPPVPTGNIVSLHPSYPRYIYCRHTITTSEVTALQHELWNDTVKLATLESETLLVRAQSAEVLSSLGDNIVEEVEVDAPVLLLDGADIGHIALGINGELGTFPAEVVLI